jgi:hypothetical protein
MVENGDHLDRPTSIAEWLGIRRRFRTLVHSRRHEGRQSISPAWFGSIRSLIGMIRQERPVNARTLGLSLRAETL